MSKTLLSIIAPFLCVFPLLSWGSEEEIEDKIENLPHTMSVNNALQNWIQDKAGRDYCQNFSKVTFLFRRKHKKTTLTNLNEVSIGVKTVPIGSISSGCLGIIFSELDEDTPTTKPKIKIWPAYKVDENGTKVLTTVNPYTIPSCIKSINITYVDTNTKDRALHRTCTAKEKQIKNIIKAAAIHKIFFSSNSLKNETTKLMWDSWKDYKKNQDFFKVVAFMKLGLRDASRKITELKESKKGTTVKTARKRFSYDKALKMLHYLSASSESDDLKDALLIAKNPFQESINLKKNKKGEIRQNKILNHFGYYEKREDYFKKIWNNFIENANIMGRETEPHKKKDRHGFYDPIPLKNWIYNSTFKKYPFNESLYRDASDFYDQIQVIFKDSLGLTKNPATAHLHLILYAKTLMEGSSLYKRGDYFGFEGLMNTAIKATKEAKKNNSDSTL